MFLTENQCFGFELTLCKCDKDDHLHLSKTSVITLQQQKWGEGCMYMTGFFPTPNGALNSKPPVKASSFFFKWVSSAQLPSIQETGSVLSSGFAIHTMLCGCENQVEYWSGNISWAHLIHMKTSQITAIILHLTQMCFPQAVPHHVNSHLVPICSSEFCTDYFRILCMYLHTHLHKKDLLARVKMEGKCSH